MVIIDKYDNIELWHIDDIKLTKSIKKSNFSLCRLIQEAKSIVNGVVKPITIDCESGYLIDGYTTYLLVRFRGVERVKVVLSGHKGDIQHTESI